MPENNEDKPRESRGIGSLKEQLEERMTNAEGTKKRGEDAEPVKRKRESVSQKPSMPAGLRGLIRGRIRVKDITSFCDEVALLLHAGLPLVPAMRTLAERTTHPGMAYIISDMADRVERGSSFTQAASVYSREFGRLFIGIFAAGERSGTLVDALRRVADRGDKIMQTRHKIVAALIYPVIVIIAAIGVIGFAFSYMMSTFQPIMEDMQIAIPSTMQTAMNLGNAFRTGGFWISIAIVVAAVALLYFIGIQFSGFRLVRDRILLRLPIVERFVKQSVVANFGRIFSTMIHAGVPLSDALQAAHDTTRNEVVRLAVERTMKNVREGGRVTPPLVREKIFPPLAYDMIHVGEETGSLGDVFERIADIYETREANDLEILGKIVQPFIIVLLALIVGFVVVALFQTYATLIGEITGGL